MIGTTESTHTSPSTRGRGGTAALTAVAFVLIGFNLRLGISSASVLLDQLDARLGLGPTTVALVLALPTLCFAAAGAASAGLARRLGTERAVTVALALLASGLAVRAFPTTAALLAGTLISSVGLAVCNVLLPALVRARFPTRVATMTSWYTTAMSLGMAASATTAIPIAHLVGGPTLGLAVWTLPALAALTAWTGRPPATSTGTAHTPTAPRVSAWGMGRTRFGLLITAAFALQTLNSYAVTGWMPTILTSHGISPTTAGALLGLCTAIGLPISLILKPLTRTATRLRRAFILLGTCLSTGYLGLLLAPTALPALWMAFIGLGLSAFPLILSLLGTACRTPQESAALSTFAQSTGYLAASVGPFAIGLCRSASGGWTIPLAVLLAAAVTQTITSLRLARTTPTPNS